MLRTFNYTNRRKIDQKEVLIRLIDVDQRVPRFHAELRFDTGHYRPDAAVYIEAYYKETRQRFSYGVASRIVPPARTSLDQIDLTGTIQFRVLVVDESGKHALILASGEGFQADTGETDEENRSSLLAVIARPLGALPWQVEFANDGKPALVVNQHIPAALEKVRSNVVFQALILPAAMRIILAKLMTSREIDEDGEIYLRWKAFAMQFTDAEPDNEHTDAFDIWLDDVIREFSKRFDLCDKLASAFREEG